MPNKESFFKSEKLKELDLELENQALELDIQMMGGTLLRFARPDDFDDKMYNTFLRNVIEYEKKQKETSRPGKLIQSIFPDGFIFPPVNELSKKLLKDKLNAIEKILGAHNIRLELVDGLPDEIAYQYVIENILPEALEVPTNPNSSLSDVWNGCSGDCPDCLQKDYCDIYLNDLDGCNPEPTS